MVCLSFLSLVGVLPSQVFVCLSFLSEDQTFALVFNAWSLARSFYYTARQKVLFSFASLAVWCLVQAVIAMPFRVVNDSSVLLFSALAWTNDPSH